MKNRGLPVFLLFVVSFFGCDTSPLALQLGPLVPSEQFNFNTGSSFYSCHDRNFMPCSTEVQLLSPTVIRFPGGTDANYYHMGGRGYGYLSAHTCGTPSDEGGGHNPIDPRKDEEYPVGENVILTLVELVKATGSRVLFTLNMYDGASYESNKAVIDFLQSQGCQIAGFELGNELYLDCYKDRFPDSAAYLDSAIYYTGRLKTDYPEIPVGVVAAPSERVGDMDPARRKRFKDWNKLMSDSAAHFDAYIVHYYSGNNSASCSSPNFSAYQMALQTDLNDWFGTSMAAYQSYFGNMPMWLTEWNTSTSLKCYGNSQLNNLFFAQYQCELASNFAAQVPVAVHHNWLGNGKHFPLMTWDGSQFQKKSSYPLFQLLKPIFEKRETRSILPPSSLAGSIPVGVKIYGYFQPPSDGNPPRLLVVGINHNVSAQSVSIDASQIIINGTTYNFQDKKLASLWASSLDATFQGTTLGNNLAGNGTIQQAENPFTNSLNLPGYAVCLAEILLGN